MNDVAYRVLARKYRPRSFDDLIGQDVLVRTLSNAFQSGRVAHAFLLTGIRGIGKTTTARIIARGLNCLGEDGNGGPTTRPCGVCPNCKMILDECHVDIIEMDAASHTGVDDIRDLIDTVHYAPAAARYKVYIIDEAHMLSKSAFNALLKTLEEPPAHVKFIFATTELRKLPITIVSRCQRFDLRRIDIAMLSEHLGNICEQESVKADVGSLQLIASAAEGSVRDALSLLDQAIAMSAQQDGTTILEAEATRDMLGIANKSSILEMLEHLFTGHVMQAITGLRELYYKGADPILLLQDLLSLIHYCTRIQMAPELAHDTHYSQAEQEKASALASDLSVPALTRAWQVLLKGIEEVKHASQPLAATEMMFIRLAYASQLPSPEQLVRAIGQDNAPAAPQSNGTSAAVPPPTPAFAVNAALATAPQPAAETLPLTQPEPVATTVAQPESYAQIVELFQQHKEMLLYSHLVNDMRLVSFQQGQIEVTPTGHVGPDVAARISRHLSEWCGQKWMLRYADASAESQPTLREQAQKAKEQRIEYAASHPHVKAVMQAFEGTKIIDVQPLDESH